MKKYLTLVLCALLVALAGTAAAATVNAVPTDRVTFDLFDGLQGAETHSYQNGVYRVDINTPKADWKKLVSTYRNPCVFWSIKAPEGIGVGDYALWLFWSYEDDGTAPSTQFMYDKMQENIKDNVYFKIEKVNSDGSVFSEEANRKWQPPETKDSVNFGDFDVNTSYAQPYDNGLAVMVAWFTEDENGNKVLHDAGYERLDIVVKHSSLNAIKVPQFQLVPASRILQDPGCTQKDFYKFQKANGMVDFIYTQKPSVRYSANYLVAPPAGATHYAWRYYNGGRISQLIERNGAGYAQRSMSTGGSGDKMANINDIDFLTFYQQQSDGSYKVLEELRCSASLYPVENYYWPAYDDQFQPFPDGRISFSNTAAGAGFSYDYTDYDNDDGKSKRGELVLNWGKPGSTPSTAALEGGLKITVSPPSSEYQYYKYWWRGSGGWRGNLGTGGDYFKWLEEELNQKGAGAYQVLSIEKDGLPTDEMEAFRKITPADNDAITIYAPTAEGPDMLIAMIIYWYKTPDASDAPHREYIWRTHTGGLQTTYVAPVKELDDFHDHPQFGQQPIFKGPPGQEHIWGEWQLMVTTYYQAGTNARHYELALLDKDGVPIQPKWKVFIYLPYPEGVTYETVSGKQFELRHYESNFYSGDVDNPTGEVIPVIPTEYGLMYETDSFSPFIVSWEDEAPAVPAPPANIPQTGDNTPVMLLAVLMILAAALLLRKKKTC